MKPIIIDMKDLSESAEIYKSTPNKIIVVFVYIMLAFTLIGVAWMSLFSIDDVVKAEGMISRDENENYQTVIYLTELDYGKVYVGQEVKFEICAYPANDYGYFHGTVKSIPKDPVIDSLTNQSCYPVVVDFKPDELKDANGKPVSLAMGLSCRADIVVGHEKIIQYLLKKL